MVLYKCILISYLIMMGLLNKDKHVNLKLEKLVYSPGEIIKGSVNFDFGEEKVKINKVTLTLREVIEKNITRYNKGYSIETKKTFRNLLSLQLVGSGEYNKGNYDFQFPIPQNIFFGKNNFSQALEKIKIKGVLGKVIELLLNLVILNKPNATYELIARVDVPWGLDITNKVNINIVDESKNFDNKLKG